MRSVPGVWRSSSICAVRCTGHNFDTSQVRFDGGEHYFGNVELPAVPEGREAGVLSPNLDPCGVKGCVMDEATSNDSEDLFPSDSELSEG